MKRIICYLLVLVILCGGAGISAADGMVTMYAVDGSEIMVPPEQVEEYKKVGWYENPSDYLPEIMYAADGRTITVMRVEIEAYKAVGWYENLSDVQRTLYAADGRTITVFLAEVEAYKAVGWYESPEDYRVVTLYAADGRTIDVPNIQVEAYKAVGWYENLSDVQRTLYAMDGREITVYLADVEAYKAVGWYEQLSDVQKTLFATNGRQITVYLAEVEAYKAVGWYESISQVQKTLYSKSGKTVQVYLDYISIFKRFGWSEFPFSKVDPTKPMIALTFDDGPKASTTSIILDTLEANGARATFFVLGSLAKRNTAILQRMDALGCQIANHSYDHPDLRYLSEENVAYQINTTSDIVNEIVGHPTSMVRPPYGGYNQNVMDIAGVPFILWSVDTLDWKYRDSEYVRNYVLENAYDGAIILMHDIHATTAEASKYFIPELIAAGYQLVTVEELAYYKGYTPESAKAYSSFVTRK